MRPSAHLRRFFIRSTDYAQGYLGQFEKQATLYRMWAPIYDALLSSFAPVHTERKVRWRMYREIFIATESRESEA